MKDSFHTYIVSGDKSSTNQDLYGTKVAPVYRIKLAAKQARAVYLRLVSVSEWDNKPRADSGVFDTRKSETDEFYEQRTGGSIRVEEAWQYSRQQVCSGASSFINIS